MLGGSLGEEMSLAFVGTGTGLAHNENNFSFWGCGAQEGLISSPSHCNLRARHADTVLGFLV